MTHITDQQRREVAARLRELEQCKPPLIPDCLCGLCKTVGAVAAPGINLCEEDGSCPEILGPLIADLIDRPTCHNTQTRVAKGGELSFTCSECGVAFDTMGGEYKGRSFYGILPCYCPNCGAEVDA